jgi:hypothetical protein
MSDVPAARGGDAPANPQLHPQANGCPLTDEFLPPNMRKHVDVKAPVGLRMMAAKGLVPLSPSDMVAVLFMLMYDPEAPVRDTAGKTAVALQDRIASSAFRDEMVPGPVLAWYLTLYGTHDAYAEMLILNANTPDQAVAELAASCGQRIAELIGANQLRLLRHDDIIRRLALNAAATGALIDGVCDFAVRNGVKLPDVPQMLQAQIRLFGPEVVVAPPVDTAPTADQLISEYGMDGGGGDEAGAAPLEETRKLTLSQKIMKMNISEKIKLATKGNKEARTVLIRDSNKLVAVAVIRSPRLTEGEVLAQAQNKVAQDDVLRVIYSNREWLRMYAVRLALVKNPKVPQGVSMRLMNQLHEADVKMLARDKNVAGSVQMMAKKHVSKKEAPKKA